jgi:transcriptional regulator with XRE-family HTH domain
MSKKKNVHAETFTKQLKKLMDDKALTQQQVADAAKVARPTVGKWLQGTVPGAGQLFDLASANGVNVQYFFEIEPKSELTYYPITGNTPEVQPRLPELIDRLRNATMEHGRKTELAKWLGVSPQKVTDWLSERVEPSGETTLRLLYWVEKQERQK